MAVLEKDYKSFGYSGFLEKTNSIFGDFKDEQVIQKKEFDGTDINDKEEKIEGEIFQIKSLKKSPVETREFIGKINPNLLSGGDASGKISFTGEIKAKNITIGRPQITIDINESIQHAINRLDDGGGGTLFLKDGTYFTETSITVANSIKVIGVSESATIIDFQNSTTNRIIVAGTNLYTTGTVIAITSRVIITGSGTEWLANVSVGQNIFLGTKWYEIASVVNDTTLVLSTQEGYTDDLVLPVSYRIATVAKDIDFENVKILNCDHASGALDYDDARNITFRNVHSNNGVIGISFTNCSEIATDSCFFIGNSNDGIEMTNIGVLDIEGTISSGNGVNGWDINNCKFGAWYACVGVANTQDGFNFTTLENCAFVSCTGSENSGHGMEFISDNDQVTIVSCTMRDNTGRGLLSTATTTDLSITSSTFVGNDSDGIELTATSDRNTITNCHFRNNGAFGIDIANSNCDDNVISSNAFSGNTSGPINDSGTGTEINGNIGVRIHNQSSSELRYSYLIC